MEFQQYLDDLKIKIKKNSTHRDFDHVTKLASEYKSHITGIGLDDQLKQFNLRESQEMFAQRKRLTQHISPAVAGSLRRPFLKVSRNKQIKSSIELGDKRREEIVQKMMSEFYGTNELNVKGLDFWLRNRFLELTFSDPNSWIVIEWTPKPLNEVVEPIPFEVKSENAVDFKITNGNLDWLLIKIPEEIQFIDRDETKSKIVDSWTIYSKGYSLKVVEYDPEFFTRNGIVVDPEFQSVWTEEKTKKNFIATFNQSNLTFVPAFRVGYLRDDATDGRTFVNPFHDAMSYFRKSLKSVSELDLTIALHTFPQKIQFVPACRGISKTKRCQNGKIAGTETTCPKCNGSGLDTHNSAQDAIFVKMPEDKSEMFNLDNILTYKSPPIDLIKFQNDYVKSLKLDTHLAVFNSNMFLADDPQFGKTATEIDINYESIHDTIFPYTEKFSEVWKTIVKTFAFLSGFNKGDSINLNHSFPADLKLKSTNMLIQEMKTANESNAPSFVIDQITNQIAGQMFNGDNYELKRFAVRHKFFPFNGKSKEEIGLLLASPYVSEWTKVLYGNFEAIFTDIEKDFPSFYEKNYLDQWKILEDAVKPYFDEIKAQSQTTPFTFNFGDQTSSGSTDQQSDETTENQ